MVYFLTLDKLERQMDPTGLAVPHLESALGLFVVSVGFAHQIS